MQNGPCGMLASPMELNAGDFLFCRIFSALQRCKPTADRYAQRLEFQPSMTVWKSIDLCDPGLKQILGALAIRSRIMVECRRDLNQALEKCLIRSGRR